MNALKNITIRTRLYLTLLLTLTIFALLMVYTVINIGQIGYVVNQITEHPLAVSNAASDAQQSVLEIYRDNQEAFIEMDSEGIARYEVLVNNEEALLKSYLDIIQEKILGAEGQKLAADAVTEINNWRSHHNELSALIFNADDRELARAYLVKTERVQVDGILEQLSAIQEYAKNRAAGFLTESETIKTSARNALIMMAIGLSGVLVLITTISISSIVTSLNKLKNSMAESIEHNTFEKAVLVGKNEVTDMAEFYNRLISKLEVQFRNREGLTGLSRVISGDMDVQAFSEKGISFLSEYTGAGNGAFYLFEPEHDRLKLTASYAFTERQNLFNQVALGEGVIGQAALERKMIVLKNILRSEAVINTGTTSQAPLSICAVPLVYEGELCGVIELSSFEAFDKDKLGFLEETGRLLAVNLYSTLQSAKIQNLLNETQEANRLMEIQQAELKIKSEELSTNNMKLNEILEETRQQSEELQTQQEELRVTNEELAERTKLLEKQREDIELKNDSLLKSKLEIEEKSRALEMSSRYKSEFLANMSHELRTPLNSILVLSQTLAEKKNTEPLTEKQLDYARTIYSAGNDLLAMINDVLDIAKVESGRIELVMEKIELESFAEDMFIQFEHMAERNNISFETTIDSTLPKTVLEDRMRLEQVLKNLISNALKFTEKGSVKLNILPLSKEIARKENLKEAENYIVYSVEDTGIGIPEDKLQTVFEAFKQVDGTISRKFGGTGLGLSISEGYAKLMGGTILVSSAVGKGSRFDLVLPEKDVLPEDSSGVLAGLNENPLGTESLIDYSLRGKTVLLADDDMRNVFALSGLMEDHGITVISAKNGLDALRVLQANPHVDLVIMDVMMPEMDGPSAMVEIRNMKEFAGLPIIALTAKSMKEDRAKCMEAGANEYLTKPIDNKNMLDVLRVWLRQ